MTLADQAEITAHDGQVTSGKPERPKRRTFTAAYKARILAEFDALPEGSEIRAVPRLPRDLSGRGRRRNCPSAPAGE